MFLSIDVGNSQTALGLFSPGGEVVRHWRMATDRTDTADEIHERLFGYFGMYGLELSDVSDAALACVVPVLAREWGRTLCSLLGREPLVVDAALDCGLPIRMRDPRQVGADRIANAVAARSTYGAPAIVVDFGTATNIDVVDSDGAYRGGAISPGLMLSANALFSKAAKLSSVPIEAPTGALGDDTESAVRSGLVIGAAAQAEGLVSRIRREIGAPTAPVVATGGLAEVVAAATDLFDAIDPDLTIRGIREIWLHVGGLA